MAATEGRRPERYWRLALDRSAAATASGALVPLHTEQLPAEWASPFLLRRLQSRTPKHLRSGGPKPNPFLPWERALQVELLASGHVLLLNKFPVQLGHLLLISAEWQPQAGWLQPADWQAVSQVAADTGGLWFFNSCPTAGASQPHRHLQLLPRAAGEPSCPLASLLNAQLNGLADGWPWPYCLSRRRIAAGQGPLAQAQAADELQDLYLDHARLLGLGSPSQATQPLHPYNLLFDDGWLMTVRREREHCAGFSLNALGFAGYLLATERSDLTWLQHHGPWQLLEAVAAPPVWQTSAIP